MSFSLQGQVRRAADTQGRLSFSLLTDRTSLSRGKAVTISKEGLLTYTAPQVTSPATDRFVFVVPTEKGCVSHNIASIKIVPN